MVFIVEAWTFLHVTTIDYTTLSQILSLKNKLKKMCDQPFHFPEIEEVDRSQYSIDESKLISFGGYGRVYEGKWKGKTVAVKRVHTFEESETKSLVTEIRINA